MITANPDLDAFIGEYGGATIGAVKAVQQPPTAVGKTVVFGGDMTTDLANALVKDNSVLKAQVDIGRPGDGQGRPSRRPST